MLSECRIATLVCFLGVPLGLTSILSPMFVKSSEVQDYTQVEILLFFYIGGPGALFLAGDPAQSVVEGTDFRFEEIRSVGHFVAGDRRHLIPEKPKIVNVNFRSHSGILNTAAVSYLLGFWMRVLEISHDLTSFVVNIRLPLCPLPFKCKAVAKGPRTVQRCQARCLSKCSSQHVVNSFKGEDAWCSCLDA